MINVFWYLRLLFYHDFPDSDFILNLHVGLESSISIFNVGDAGSNHVSAHNFTLTLGLMLNGNVRAANNPLALSQYNGCGV